MGLRIYTAKDCHAEKDQFDALLKIKRKEEEHEKKRLQELADSYAKDMFCKYGSIFMGYATSGCASFFKETKSAWPLYASFIHDAIRASTDNYDNPLPSYSKEVEAKVWKDLQTYPEYGISKLDAAKALIRKLDKELSVLGFKCDHNANISSFGGVYFKEPVKNETYEMVLDLPLTENGDTFSEEVFRIKKYMTSGVKPVLFIAVPGKFPLLDKIADFLSRYFS